MRQKNKLKHQVLLCHNFSQSSFESYLIKIDLFGGGEIMQVIKPAK